VGIDRAAPEYIYLQLASDLRRQIDDGTLRGRLPPLSVLQDEYEVASMTVRKAIRILVDEGLVVTYPGRGSFVRLPGQRSGI
jgi:GntR family transcriptional regulator